MKKIQNPFKLTIDLMEKQAGESGASAVLFIGGLMYYTTRELGKFVIRTVSGDKEVSEQDIEQVLEQEKDDYINDYKTGAELSQDKSSSKIK